MAYHERSFLDGLAAGLAATNGRRLGALRRQLTTGTSRVALFGLPEGNFNIFVSKIIFDTREAHTVEYEFGPVGGELQKEFRRVQASTELQTFYHVVQIPEALPMAQFAYGAYFYEPDEARTAFDSYFMAFPYHKNGQDYLYPGSPEATQKWISRTFRGFPA